MSNIAPPAAPPAAQAWPYRKAVFIHGIEWLFDKDLRGYSRDLQNGILAKLPRALRASFDPARDFVEVLWSNVVEADERSIMAGLEIVGYIASGNFPLAVKTAVNELANVEHVAVLQPDSKLTQFLGYLLPGSTLPGLSVAEDAASAILDVAFYFTDHYGDAIRKRIREQLVSGMSQAGPPVVFAHSLGSVAIIDIILEDLRAGKPSPVGRLVTAGSPLGLFNDPTGIGVAFQALMWENYYDPADFVAPWNPLADKGFLYVSDYPIKVEVLPALGHLNYWMSETIASAMITALFG